MAACPGAVGTISLADASRRAATSAEADELRAIVERVYTDEADRAEILPVVLADPEAALTSYRESARAQNGR